MKQQEIVSEAFQFRAIEAALVKHDNNMRLFPGG